MPLHPSIRWEQALQKKQFQWWFVRAPGLRGLQQEMGPSGQTWGLWWPTSSGSSHCLGGIMRKYEIPPGEPGFYPATPNFVCDGRMQTSKTYPRMMITVLRKLLTRVWGNLAILNLNAGGSMNVMNSIKIALTQHPYVLRWNMNPFLFWIITGSPVFGWKSQDIIIKEVWSNIIHNILI